MIELKKSLAAYGVELLGPSSLHDSKSEDPLRVVGPVDASTEPEAEQLSFELERPPPKLRALRRHPSI